MANRGVARAALEAAFAENGGELFRLVRNHVNIGLAVDVETRRPKLAFGTGGLSGPAIRPVAVRMTWQVARAGIAWGATTEWSARDTERILPHVPQTNLRAGRECVPGSPSFVSPASSARLRQPSFVNAPRKWRTA